MTPKEKARELYEIFLDIGLGHDWAKECALIAVYEIIKSEPKLPMFFNYCVGDDNPSGTTWWILVKQELEKL